MSKNQKSTKYQRWYEELCAKAKNRTIPTAYTEVHHIQPRSLGGSDDPSNLVRLEYREHFIAHWLLTKLHTGRNLQKMQKALWAMTMKTSGERTPTGWQFEAAKRAIRDMELEDDDAAYLERWRATQQKKMEEAHAVRAQAERRSNEKQFINDLLFSSDRPDPYRSEFRALILKKYSDMHASEFDHQLIAKYFDAPHDVLYDHWRLLVLGRRGYLVEKFRKLETAKAS